jgi:hypothetical protein
VSSTGNRRASVTLRVLPVASAASSWSFDHFGSSSASAASSRICSTRMQPWLNVRSSNANLSRIGVSWI